MVYLRRAFLMKKKVRGGGRFVPSVRPHVPYYVRLFPIAEIRERTNVAESGVSGFEAWQFRDSKFHPGHGDPVRKTYHQLYPFLGI